MGGERRKGRSGREKEGTGKEGRGKEGERSEERGRRGEGRGRRREMPPNADSWIRPWTQMVQ